jgi:hypothetical protein
MATLTFKFSTEDTRGDATRAFNNLQPTQHVTVCICEMQSQCNADAHVLGHTGESFALLQYDAGRQGICILPDLMLKSEIFLSEQTITKAGGPTPWRSADLKGAIGQWYVKTPR